MKSLYTLHASAGLWGEEIAVFRSDPAGMRRSLSVENDYEWRTIMSIASSLRKISQDDIYPYSDGEPMAESELHAGEMNYAHYSLEIWLQNRPDAHVSTDTFLYYRKGDPSAVVSPDHYVVFGLDKELRKSYLVWQEGGKLPSFVLEITSKSTRMADFPPRPNGIPRPGARRRHSAEKNKYQIYEQILGVEEYFLFDPTGDYLKPRLRGFRLIEGRYVPIEVEPQPLPNLPPERQPTYWLYSEQLGLAFAHEGIHLCCYDPVSGAPLLRAAEAVHLAQVQSQRAEAEALRAAEAMQWAEREAQRAEREAQRAELEAQARAGAEAEIARLRAELAARSKE
jgi:Uma2 family endonuclease